jgi:hypothetical protein
MSEQIRMLAYALWIAHPLLQTAIAIVMLRRGQYRHFKFFFVYIGTQILIFAVVFPAYLRNYSGYFNLFWLTSGISMLLGLKVIYEAFLDVFRPFQTWRDLGIVLFKWAGLLMLLVAGVVSVSTRSSDTAPWVEGIMTAQRCIRIIQVAMVLLLLFLARHLGISRRQLGFGVALGFGVFAMVELATNATWARYRVSDMAMSLVNMVAYDSALLIWLGYTLARSPVNGAAWTLARARQREQTIIDIHELLPADSSIPRFEGLIDRDLSPVQLSPSSPIYKELRMLETELNENIKALKFTSTQISRRLGRLNILARNPRTRGQSSEDA